MASAKVTAAQRARLQSFLSTALGVELHEFPDTSFDESIDALRSSWRQKAQALKRGLSRILGKTGSHVERHHKALAEALLRKSQAEESVLSILAAVDRVVGLANEVENKARVLVSLSPDARQSAFARRLSAEVEVVGSLLRGRRSWPSPDAEALAEAFRRADAKAFCHTLTTAVTVAGYHRVIASLEACTRLAESAASAYRYDKVLEDEWHNAWVAREPLRAHMYTVERGAFHAYSFDIAARQWDMHASVSKEIAMGLTRTMRALELAAVLADRLKGALEDHEPRPEVLLSRLGAIRVRMEGLAKNPDEQTVTGAIPVLGSAYEALHEAEIWLADEVIRPRIAKALFDPATGPSSSRRRKESPTERLARELANSRLYPADPLWELSTEELHRRIRGLCEAVARTRQ